jgi:hypothetical protein
LGELAEKIDGKADSIQSEPSSKPIMGSARFNIEPVHRLSSAPSNKGERKEDTSSSSQRQEGPSNPKMNYIWEKSYKKRSKSYIGTPDVIKQQILNDPAVRLMFNPPKDFLSIIGWKTMSQQTEISKDLDIEMAFFSANEFTVHTRFPYGIQDTTFSYRSTDGEESFQIVSIHRHRSEKRVDGAPNFFTGMIAEQASGAAKLGVMRYDSDSIRADNAWGYNVWPKHGFDGEVPENCLINMKSDTTPDLQLGVGWLNRQDEVCFSDMFKIKENNIYNQLKILWREHGKTVGVNFNILPGSASWETLDRYANEKISPNFQRVEITGITHSVQIKGNSIFNGKEMNELEHGQIVVIDPSDKYRSRRGPNQETSRARDKVRDSRIFRWFRVITIDGKHAGAGIYLRDETFKKTLSLSMMWFV